MGKAEGRKAEKGNEGGILGSAVPPSRRPGWRRSRIFTRLQVLVWLISPPYLIPAAAFYSSLIQAYLMNLFFTHLRWKVAFWCIKCINSCNILFLSPLFAFPPHTSRGTLKSWESLFTFIKYQVLDQYFIAFIHFLSVTILLHNLYANTWKQSLIIFKGLFEHNIGTQQGMLPIRHDVQRTGRFKCFL